MKVNMDINITSGKSSFTNRIGVQYTARPDNIGAIPVAIIVASFLSSPEKAGQLILDYEGSH
jgi:hypothetical protein